MVTKPINLFYSYAEEDEKLRIKLEKHLSQLKRQGKIAPWHFRKITGGKEWKDEINQNLKEAKIILLLVSASFLGSDYCIDVEMDLAMKLHRSKSARVIPIILRSCDWKDTPIGNLQAFPKSGKPVIKWSDLDDAFLDVVQGIKGVIDELSLPPKPNIKSTIASNDNLTNSEPGQATNSYCSRCGSKAGSQSECIGDYNSHKFKEYSGDVFCSFCGIRAGRRTECIGDNAYHTFKEYPGNVFCFRCGSKVGIQTECIGDFTCHTFREYSGEVCCSRCGAKAGHKSECIGDYTYHNFREFSEGVCCSHCGAKVGRQSECIGNYTYHNFKEPR